jgi:LytR cell envelope-related transcriptional attenuator
VNVKTPLTLLVLVLILAGAVFYGWRSVGASASSASPAPTRTTSTGPKCTKVKHLKKGQRVRAADVVVNVFNAGHRTGLASDIMSKLARRGFRQGIVANAPGNVAATNVTIATPTKQAPEVRLVAHQFQRPIAYRRHDMGAGVDVVLGNGFQGMAAHAKPFLVVQRSGHTCVDNSSATP